jgi:hypothetical protein
VATIMVVTPLHSTGHAASPCLHAHEPSHGSHTSLSTDLRGRYKGGVRKAGMVCTAKCVCVRGTGGAWLVRVLLDGDVQRMSRHTPWHAHARMLTGAPQRPATTIEGALGVCGDRHGQCAHKFGGTRLECFWMNNTPHCTASQPPQFDQVAGCESCDVVSASALLSHWQSCMTCAPYQPRTPHATHDNNNVWSRRVPHRA